MIRLHSWCTDVARSGGDHAADRYTGRRRRTWWWWWWWWRCIDRGADATEALAGRGHGALRMIKSRRKRWSPGVHWQAWRAHSVIQRGERSVLSFIEGLAALNDPERRRSRCASIISRFETPSRAQDGIAAASEKRPRTRRRRRRGTLLALRHVPDVQPRSAAPGQMAGASCTPCVSVAVRW